MPAPFPPEFRRRAVELGRERAKPIAQIAGDLGIAEPCLRCWMAEADVDEGKREGLTPAEREELTRLRRENRVLRMERELRSRAAAFFASENVLPLMIYRFMDAQKAGFRIRLMARRLGVSPSGLYEWQHRWVDPSPWVREDAVLTATIREIHRLSRGSSGSPSVWADLRLGAGIRVGRKRVARLMRQAQLPGVSRRSKGSARRNPADLPSDDHVTGHSPLAETVLIGSDESTTSCGRAMDNRQWRQQGRRSVDRRSLPDVAASPSDASQPLRRTGLRNPVVFVLLAAGVGDAVTGNPVDALLLVGVGIALARSGKTSRSEVDSLRRAAPRSGKWIPPAVATALVYALVVGGFHRQSWPITFAIVVPSTVALVIAWREPMTVEPPPIDPLGARLWAGVFVTLGLWELANLLMQPSLLEGSYDHPTLSVLSDPFLFSHGGRSVALFAWVGLGWYLVER